MRVALKKIGCVVIILICLLVFTHLLVEIVIGPIVGAGKGRWQSRAKINLRGYGEAQLAYSHVNLEGYYGSWEALRRTGYVPEGYTMGNSIENYSMYIRLYKPTMSHTSQVPAFTAIAFPMTTSPPGYLATFAIREDQILRMYRPEKKGVKDWGEYGDFGARTWEPIR